MHLVTFIHFWKAPSLSNIRTHRHKSCFAGPLHAYDNRCSRTPEEVGPTSGFQAKHRSSDMTRPRTTLIRSRCCPLHRKLSLNLQRQKIHRLCCGARLRITRSEMYLPVIIRVESRCQALDFRQSGLTAKTMVVSNTNIHKSIQLLKLNSTSSRMHREKVKMIVRPRTPSAELHVSTIFQRFFVISSDKKGPILPGLNLGMH